MSRNSLLAALLLSSHLASVVSSQQILQFGPGALPDCSRSCPELLEAQTTCIPADGAPTGSPETYKECFCHSSVLIRLKIGPVPILCALECPDSTARTEIATWYESYCASDELPQVGGGSSSMSMPGASLTLVSSSGSVPATSSGPATDTPSLSVAASSNSRITSSTTLDSAPSSSSLNTGTTSQPSSTAPAVASTSLTSGMAKAAQCGLAWMAAPMIAAAVW